MSQQRPKSVKTSKSVVKKDDPNRLARAGLALGRVSINAQIAEKARQKEIGRLAEMHITKHLVRDQLRQEYSAPVSDRELDMRSPMRRIIAEEKKYVTARGVSEGRAGKSFQAEAQAINKVRAAMPKSKKTKK